MNLNNKSNKIKYYKQIIYQFNKININNNNNI